MFLTTDEIFFKTEKRLEPLSFIKNTNELTNVDTASVRGLVVRLGFNVDKSVLDALSDLKVVATITTGLNHIDTKECLQRGIEVISLKEEISFLETIKATPELTWSLLLALVRNIDGAFASVKNGAWDRQRFYGNELSGKTIGIYGLGRVGKIIKQYAEAFGMKVIASDLKKDVDATYVSPHELFEQADVLSVHLPLEEQTKAIVNRELLQKMKPTAVLINTARGEIIDESALLEVLESGKISGAAVDVLSDEINFNGDCTSSKLVQYAMKNTNLIITPHIAGSTHESMERTAEFIGKKVYEFLN
jgi:D-3-phosphoglycerate dehydrogenase